MSSCADSYEQNDHEVYDVIIVGAGPCGLATAARLREKHPSALFTDEEQSRYTWMSRNSHRTSIKNKKNGRINPKSTCMNDDRPSILVLDSSGKEWMHRWNSLFKTFEISHLRSPMFFHPDPSDRDALLAFVHEQERTGELEEIANCVGKEVSKHKWKKRSRARNSGAQPVVEIDERDRKDYWTPSTRCFKDFCDSCRKRYSLSETLIEQQSVQDIEYDVWPSISETEKLFRVRTGGPEYMARTVIVAIGAGTPIVPQPFSSDLREGTTHAMDLKAGGLLTKDLQRKITSQEQTNVLVMGGGLTSAQISDALIRRGVSKVWLVMRSHWKVKPFDVDLSWMSKFKNRQRAVFWTAENLQERLALVQEARNGGSMTPRFAKLLKRHMCHGRLAVLPCTTVQSEKYCESSKTRTITTDPPQSDLPAFDHVFFATGQKIDIDSLEMIKSIRKQRPVASCGGLPALTDDLMWSDDIPLFFTGKLATLQLGPGAGNLEGARLGAERIAWSVEDVLNKHDNSHDAEDGGVVDGFDRYVSGVGSRFEQLGLDDCDCDA